MSDLSLSPPFTTVVLSDLKGNLWNRIHLFVKEKKPPKHIYRLTSSTFKLDIVEVGCRSSNFPSVLTGKTSLNWALVTIFSTRLWSSATRHMLKKQLITSPDLALGSQLTVNLNIYWAISVCWRRWWTQNKYSGQSPRETYSWGQKMKHPRKSFK